MNKRIPIIIDTDPGVDDAIAIFLANSSQKLDVIAITSVGGNVSGDQTFRNALSLAHHLDMSTIVAKGAGKALIIENEDASWVHGRTGMGELELPIPDNYNTSKKAWDVIHEQAIKHSKEIVIVTIGPLTNIAIALAKYPDLVEHVKEIRMMGGSAYYGNHSPYGEFNAWGDPHATAMVFQSGIPITMVGLNVTCKAVLPSEDMAYIRSIKSKIQEPMDILFNQMEYLNEKFGLEDVSIHDALAIGSLIDEDIIQTKEYYVCVETQSDASLGRTVVDYTNMSKHSTNATVAMEVDVAKFVHLLRTMAQTYGGLCHE